ncbi:chemotaxis protein CheW [Bacterioplanes sanyensis]|nr:chemotaxis protein CheW [Bacterioplanes sanyensis]
MNVNDMEEPEGNEQQYLTFIMANEEYGVDILAVQEIRGWEPTTSIPNAPDYIGGVINLRGTIVPIMDLRMRFGLPIVEYSPVTVVVILKVIADNNEKIMGIVVDAVSDVYSIRQSDVRQPPDMNQDENTGFLRGLVSVKEKMVILLDVATLITSHQDLELPVMADSISETE